MASTADLTAEVATATGLTVEAASTEDLTVEAEVRLGWLEGFARPVGSCHTPFWVPNFMVIF